MAIDYTNQYVYDVGKKNVLAMEENFLNWVLTNL